MWFHCLSKIVLWICLNKKRVSTIRNRSLLFTQHRVNGYLYVYFWLMQSLLQLWSLSKGETTTTTKNHTNRTSLSAWFTRRFQFVNMRTYYMQFVVVHIRVLVFLVWTFLLAEFSVFQKRTSFQKSTYGYALILADCSFIFHLTLCPWHMKSSEIELSRILNPFKWLTVTYLRHFINWIAMVETVLRFFLFHRKEIFNSENRFVRNEVQ